MPRKIVHRHPIFIDDGDHHIECCGSAKVIHVGYKAGEIARVQIWTEQADPLLEKCTRTFRIFDTGQPIPDGYHHKGSVVVGEFVWHVYERSQYPRD